MITLDATTGESIANAIKDVLLRLNIDIKLCRGQVYDGANSMRGVNKGVKAHIQKVVPEAVYVYCKNHGLNLDLQHSIESTCWTHELMQFLDSTANFIRGSRKRFAVVKSLHQDLRPEVDLNVGVKRPVCPTRWVLRGSLVNAVYEEYEVLLNSMVSVSQNSDPKASTTAKGICVSIIFCCDADFSRNWITKRDEVFIE